MHREPEPSRDSRDEGPPAGPGPADHGRPVAGPVMARTGVRPPLYAHRPGVTPHPSQTPGHLPAVDELALRIARGRAADASDGAMQAAMLAAIRLGADLHDGGWWWEAHEAWEIPWLAWPREAPRARLLQALIQDAAAWLQLERGRPAGVARLLARAAVNRRRALAGAPGDRDWIGLDHARRQRDVAAYLAGRGVHDAADFPSLPARFAGSEVR